MRLHPDHRRKTWNTKPEECDKYVKGKKKRMENVAGMAREVNMAKKIDTSYQASNGRHDICIKIGIKRGNRSIKERHRIPRCEFCPVGN